MSPTVNIDTRFFDRIAKTYRKERWYTVLSSILLLSLDCARVLNMWNKVIEYLIELLSEREWHAYRRCQMDIRSVYYNVNILCADRYPVD